LSIIGYLEGSQYFETAAMLSPLSSHAVELKHQGAAEAARDPNSNITSEDAEQSMVDETKKAGIAAYQFDPHASPEEKAAQARSVSHVSGIHEMRFLLMTCSCSMSLQIFITRRSPRVLQLLQTL